MRDIIKSKISLFIAIVGLIGGLIWSIKVNFEPEPIILTIVSLIEIFGFFLVPELKETQLPIQRTKNEQSVNVNVNVGHNISKQLDHEHPVSQSLDRETILNTMNSKTNILFIDDDQKFKVVKILIDSGWKKTKTVIDVKTLDVPVIKSADIVFVDINGVGKILKLEYEGLDLALMIKQKYPLKKVIIYSANRNSNSFHEAWDVCDFKLEKNALPYQFQNLVEEYSIEQYHNQK